MNITSLGAASAEILHGGKRVSLDPFSFWMCRLTSIFSCCPWTFLFVNCGENNCLSFWIFLPVCTLNFYIIMIYFPYLFFIYFCHLKKTWLCISIWELMSAVSTQSHSADVYILVLLPTIVCVLCKLNFVMSLCVCAIFCYCTHCLFWAEVMSCACFM